MVKKLTSVYHEQLALYQKVLGLVENERHALARCEPLAGIIDSFREKRDLLSRIELMDRSITGEKEEYLKYRAAFDPDETSRLNDVVKSIKNMIRQIMELEERNEQTILTYGDPAETAGAVMVED